MVDSRAAAQQAIADGRVSVRGATAHKAATLVAPDDSLELLGEGPPYVSRGGRKLAAALDAFGLDVKGRRAIDVGASTGGFTDCLLQRGASSVLALDVGYGQLDWKLRSDPRVTVMDRTNVRNVDPPALGAPFDVVVADLSFISLTKVMDVLAGLGTAGTDWVMLVKPQFEAGPDSVEPGGVVRQPAVRRRAIESVAEAASEAGLTRRGGLDSPVPGAKSGNVEHLLWFTKGTA